MHICIYTSTQTIAPLLVFSQMQAAEQLFRAYISEGIIPDFRLAYTSSSVKYLKCFHFYDLMFRGTSSQRYASRISSV